MNEEYLEDEATRPTSNDHYAKTIVSKKKADADDTWLPYIYETIICNECKKDSGYMAKNWFAILRQESVLNGFSCNECI